MCCVYWGKEYQGYHCVNVSCDARNNMQGDMFSYKTITLLSLGKPGGVGNKGDKRLTKDDIVHVQFEDNHDKYAQISMPGPQRSENTQNVAHRFDNPPPLPPRGNREVSHSQIKSAKELITHGRYASQYVCLDATFNSIYLVTIYRYTQ